jgi:hypothetical protein
MDPRVSISRNALEQQYLLAHQVASLMGLSFTESAAAKTAGHAKAAAALEALNADAGSLLDTIDGADAPPTQQAIEAVRSLEGRLRAIQNR